MHRNRYPIVTAAAAAVILLTVSMGTVAQADDSGTPANAIPFGPQSFWRTSLRSAPIDPESRAMVDYMVSTISDRYNGVAAFNAHQYNSHLYTVDGTVRTTDFAFDDCQRKGYVPAGLLGSDGQFKSVPVPSDAIAATGSDAELSIYSSATDQLWEFWKARKRSDGTWSACWGGRLDHVSSSAGYFRGNFGATATGLPNAGGLVRLSEIRAGYINHAMSLAIPNPANWPSFRWPAQRSDGSDANSAALPEGSRLRLDPNIDLSSLRLSPAALTIARAAQQYGFVIVDKSGAVSVLAEAVSPTATGADPWSELLGSPDYAVMKNFPWSKLEVVADGWQGQPTSLSGSGVIGGGAAQASPPATSVVASSPEALSGSSVPAEAHAVPTATTAPTGAAPIASNGTSVSEAPKTAAEATAAREAKARTAASEQAAAHKAASRKAAAQKATSHKAAARKATLRKAAARKAALRKATTHKTSIHKVRQRAHT